jgi:intracellular sulfur oxidation DsrE/DsrF family protein
MSVRVGRLLLLDKPSLGLAYFTFRSAARSFFLVFKEYIMRTSFRWVVLLVFASLSLTSLALAANEQTTAVKKPPTHSSKAKSLKALAAIPAPKPHRILIQVDQNDPAVMNLALNNATNLIDYYRAKHVDVKVDLVTYGPGLHMLRDDTSPVKDRIKQLKDYAFPSTVQFSACNNTKENMEKKEGKPISLVSEAVIVPAGVVHLTELQEKGWTYLKP